MLERLAGNQYYCFLDCFSDYFQIHIYLKDQEKTTFICPYGMFAYRRMPFGLCNAPVTFQRCMMAIFHDMIEKTMEVFMDDFSVFGNCFQSCLSHLEKMLKRFIKDFLKIARPMTCLLEKDTPLHFSKECVEAIQTLKRKLTEASILMLATLLSVQSWGNVKKNNSGQYTMPALKHANFDLQTAGDHNKVQLNELNELRDQAYENSLIYKEKTKRLYDSKIKDRVFNIDDRVLLFNSRLKIFSGKLKSRWSGPFTISHVFPYGTVELSQPDGPNFKVNGHILKHYFGEDVPKMVVPNLQTFPKGH
nr:reverse transcriptase domain-containing protein [Tanacetum cinerariifolium]